MNQTTPSPVNSETRPPADKPPIRPQPFDAPGNSLNHHMRPPRRRRWPWVVAFLLLALIAAVVTAVAWYNDSLKPRDPAGQAVVFTVESGDAGAAIASKLEEQGLIKNRYSFQLALRLSGRADKIKVGSYRLAASESAIAIMNKLESGEVDVVMLQISPGTTLNNVKAQFVDAGFRKDLVDQAFNRTYDHPLLSDKPAGASLEGYIFPDTYQLDLQAGPEAAVELVLDTFYQKLQADNLIEPARAKNLNLHQLITLASIIEKEVSNNQDKPHVAQVFLKRLAEDMPLGSDVTFIYAAQLLGVEPTPELQSPYNTRIVKGLPPGPVANMRLEALKAVVNPSATDDLYFVAGDDGVTYFAKTLEEHEANTARYCTTLCQ